MSEPAPGVNRPVLRVVGGDPTPEELAAVTAVVAAASGGDLPAEPEKPRGRWNDPYWAHRRPSPTGPGAWRSSLRR